MDKVKPIHPVGNKKVWIVIAMFVIGIIGAASYLYLKSKSPYLNRPQEPQGPFSYSVEDVSFQNVPADITLAGTLTLPLNTKENHPYPAVILISGYGPQNRDAEWYGHKPFLIIADYLTKKGVAVLRYDDRGFGKSTGSYQNGTSLDFSTDVESAIQFLKTRKEIDPTRIGLIGHSDGAMIAPMVAARNNHVSFIVMLAGPGMLGSELMVKRQEMWARKAGKSDNEVQESTQYMKNLINIVVNSPNETTLAAELTRFGNEVKEQIPSDQIPNGMSRDEFISQQTKMLSSPWFKFFFTYDPASDLKKVKCPVLAITGDKDVQAPIENLHAIADALLSGGNRVATIKELKGLNHMLQECTTGMIDEYATIDQTISPVVLNEICEFVLRKTSLPNQNVRN